jgi:hypothetical protein
MKTPMPGQLASWSIVRHCPDARLRWRQGRTVPPRARDYRGTHLLVRRRRWWGQSHRRGGSGASQIRILPDCEARNPVFLRILFYGFPRIAGRDWLCLIDRAQGWRCGRRSDGRRAKRICSAAARPDHRPRPCAGEARQGNRFRTATTQSVHPRHDGGPRRRGYLSSRGN